MKARTIIILIVAILIVDQGLKIWVKTNMPLSHKKFEMSEAQSYKYQYGIHPFGENSNWCQLFFVENTGMAWGQEFGGEFGKIALTLFRFIAVVFGVFYIRKILKKGYHKGFIICVGLIFAGAFGNLIDSAFYGMIFNKGSHFDPAIGEYVRYYDGVASFSSKGYSSFLHGAVVDMFYFPIIETHYPSWFPFWGGQEFEFFAPVFNLADASISIGVIILLLFQRRFFPHTADKKGKGNDESLLEGTDTIKE